MAPADQLKLSGLGRELHKTLKGAGVHGYHVAELSLVARTGPHAPHCRMVEQPDGSFRIVCD
ncbi:MAG: hypothetical protein ABSG76_15255 [Xanthobacteraceae bacterium]